MNPRPSAKHLLLPALLFLHVFPFRPSRKPARVEEPAAERSMYTQRARTHSMRFAGEFRSFSSSLIKCTQKPYGKTGHLLDSGGCTARIVCSLRAGASWLRASGACRRGHGSALCHIFGRYVVTILLAEKSQNAFSQLELSIPNHAFVAVLPHQVPLRQLLPSAES